MSTFFQVFEVANLRNSIQFIIIIPRFFSLIVTIECFSILIFTYFALYFRPLTLLKTLFILLFLFFRLIFSSFTLIFLLFPFIFLVFSFIFSFLTQNPLSFNTQPRQFQHATLGISNPRVLTPQTLVFQPLRP